MATEESLSETPEKLIGTTVANKYNILKILGKGSFGVCYEGLDITNNMRVALKIESDQTFKEHKHLVNSELEAHQILNESEGIPKLLAQGISNHKHIIVMELLGEDLSNLFHKFSKKFSLKTILMLGEQMINRTRSIHHKCLIHRDLKPENFLIGLKGENRKKLFLTDFGLVKRYFDEQNGRHLPSLEKTAFSGTVRYCSVNAHNGQSMSRRDDLESIAYILIYFVWGSLPWDGWETTKSDQFYNEVKEKKESILDNKFCEQIPEVIKGFLKYCRLLEYQEIPDYNHWLQMFLKQQFEYKFVWDYKYDWIS